MGGGGKSIIGDESAISVSDPSTKVIDKITRR